MRRAAILLAACLACATGPSRDQMYRGLSPDSRELFDRYHQFLTEHQEEEFLRATSDEARKQMIADLHIEERLQRYPEFIRKAIWSETPAVGMDKPALFMTLGRPDNVDREDADPEDHTLPKEIWYYRRGPQVDQQYQIVIVNDQVVEVKTPNAR